MPNMAMELGSGTAAVGVGGVDLEVQSGYPRLAWRDSNSTLYTFHELKPEMA